MQTQKRSWRDLDDAFWQPAESFDARELDAIALDAGEGYARHQRRKHRATRAKVRAAIAQVKQ
jgi:hypothetical protein